VPGYEVKHVMPIKEKLAIPALILIAISAATAFMAKGGTGNKTTTAVEGYVIPFLGSVQDAMEKGYIDGYIAAKLLSVNVTPGKLIKAKAQITYIGLASAPSRLPVKIEINGGWTPSILDTFIKLHLDRYGGINGRAFTSLVSKGVARLDEDVKGRIWVYVWRTVILDKPKRLVLERNKTITVTFVLRPILLNPAEKGLLCDMLRAGSRLGSTGTAMVELNPLIHSDKLLSGNFNIPGIKIYYLICRNNIIINTREG